MERERHEKALELKPGKKSCASTEKDGKTTTAEGRSHDGVFLRPAVTSSQSPPLNARLSKRTSVDSGIGVEVNRQNVLRTSKYLKDFQKFSRFVGVGGVFGDQFVNQLNLLQI